MVTASDKVRAYEQELNKKKLATAIYSVIVVVCTLFLIMLFSGDKFNQYLALIGLEGISNREGGVYADCSLPENQSSPYCQTKETPQQRNWKMLRDGGSAPFSLHGQ